MTAASDTSSLSPPPSTLSSLSPEPESSSLSPPPPSPTRGKPVSTNGVKRKAKPPKEEKKKKSNKADKGDKLTIKVKQYKSPKKQVGAKEEDKEKKKKPLAKPREPKIELIPRSVQNNSDVPLIVLFRSKFRSLFSGTSELGPQDVEEGVSVEGDLEGKLEEFVCRICALIGNRRKAVEYADLFLECGLANWTGRINWERCCRRR
jgi:hypothetical protein